MEFRIKVFLHDFFVDYRKVCYLFVSKDMKVIQDLINRIAVTFNLNSNLYLTTESVYLPHFEDIRILKTDDVVVVSRNADTETIVKKKSKCKTPKESSNAAVSNQYFDKRSNNEETKIAGNCKFAEPVYMVVDEIEGEDCIDSATKPPKKKKKKKDRLSQIDNDIPLETEFITVTDTESTSTIKNPNLRADVSKPLRVAEAVVAEFTRRKTVDLLPISTAPKIVKPIIVYENSDRNVLEDKVCDVSSSSSDESSQVPKSIEAENCAGKILPEAMCNDFNNANLFDVDVFQNKKRKRKRVRTRKPKVAPIPIPLPLTTPISSAPSSPRQHIRFDYNTVDANVIDNLLTNGTEVNEENVVDVDKMQTVNYKDLCEKEITSFPIMKGVEPKVNDIIAFKRFMLSEDYTPEISNYIIGSVCSYSPIRSTVGIKVLEGKEHCSDPKGKFYVEENENSVSNRQEIQFVWSELIEPRLLFP